MITHNVKFNKDFDSRILRGDMSFKINISINNTNKFLTHDALGYWRIKTIKATVKIDLPI